MGYVLAQLDCVGSGSWHHSAGTESFLKPLEISVFFSLRGFGRAFLCLSVCLSGFLVGAEEVPGAHGHRAPRSPGAVHNQPLIVIKTKIVGPRSPSSQRGAPHAASSDTDEAGDARSRPDVYMV